MQLAENVIVAERFRLNRLLGRGGMGSVWHATHLGLDTECAVKFIEGEYANLPEAQQRFEREARAAASLRSPHVVQIMDHGLWDGTPYIAMELLDGEDLGKRLQRMPGGRMPLPELNTVISQVCRALTKAHGAGIVHRDLKPDNIFLVRDDDREIAKVLDFGIAKKNSTALESGSNTKTGAMLGTPYYMSPEQAQGIKGVDYRSDLWSLAVIVYQAVTGHLPFESEALGDLLIKIIVAPVPIPSSFAPVPPGFDRWFAKAADRSADGRFQSAKEFAESLSIVLGQSSVTEMMDVGAMRALAQTQAQVAATGNFPASNGNVPVASSGALPNTPTNPHLASGAVLANTLGGMPAGVPTKKGGGAVIAAVAALLVFGIAGAGVYVFVKKPASGGHATTTAEPPATAPTMTAAATPSASTTPTMAATAIGANTTVPDPATTASAAPTATATAKDNVAATKPHWAPAPPPKPHVAPPMPRPGPADMGF